MQLKTFVISAAAALFSATVVASQVTCSVCLEPCPAGTTCASIGEAINPVLGLVNAILDTVNVSIASGLLDGVSVGSFNTSDNMM